MTTTHQHLKPGSSRLSRSDQSDPTDQPVLVRRRCAARATGRSGPRMLLMHGLASSGSVWEACADLLPPGSEVWLAELPWRGEGVAGWSREGDLSGWMSEALASVDGGAEVVIAHSMSANVLLHLLDEVSRGGVDPFTKYGIRALVLVSPFYRRNPEDFDWDSISHHVNDFHVIMEEGIRVHAGDRFPAELLGAMAIRVRDQVGPYGWLRFFDLYLRAPELQTARVTVPCLVVSGEGDSAAPPGESETLAAALPDARLCILPGCGHFPMIEAANRFAAEVTAFVNSAEITATPSHPRTRTPLEQR